MLVVLALSSETAEENAEKIFYLVDRNNDGFISVEEYKAVTHDIFLLANEKKISTSNKDQLMKSSFGDMDLNMDGWGNKTHELNNFLILAHLFLGRLI